MNHPARHLPHLFRLLLLIAAMVLLGELAGAAAPGAHIAYLPIAQTAPDAPERNLDPRLIGVDIIEADVQLGEAYWFAKEVIYLDPTEAAGGIAIRWNVLDADGNRVIGQPATVSYGDEAVIVLTEDKPAPEYSANFPMFNPGCAYSLTINGLPSDTVTCLGLGHAEGRYWRNDHVEYWIVFEQRVGE